MHRHTPAAFLGTLLTLALPASAGTLGTDFLFECPQCTPALAEHFIGKTGPADYSARFDGYPWYEVDVEASTISVTALVEGYTRSPLIFRLSWSPAQFRLVDATIASSSSFQTSYSWGPGELVLDMGDQYFTQGAKITFDVAAAPVPEPSAWLLASLGAAVLWWRQQRAATTAGHRRRFVCQP